MQNSSKSLIYKSNSMKISLMNHGSFVKKFWFFLYTIIL